jgi:hypothetical protein
MTKSQGSGPSGIETTLAYMGAGIIGLSLVSIMITLIASFFGSTTNLAIFAQIPLLGMPAGFIMIMVLLGLALARKGRENKR